MEATLTRAQLRLAAADAAFVILWLIMNFCWMWEWYAPAMALAVPTCLSACAMIAFTEDGAVPMCTTASNAGWFLKDFFWMLENSGRLPSGVWLGTICFAATLSCCIAALAYGQATAALSYAMSRLRRIRLLVYNVPRSRG